MTCRLGGVPRPVLGRDCDVVARDRLWRAGVVRQRSDDESGRAHELTAGFLGVRTELPLWIGRGQLRHAEDLSQMTPPTAEIYC